MNKAAWKRLFARLLSDQAWWVRREDYVALLSEFEDQLASWCKTRRRKTQAPHILSSRATISGNVILDRGVEILPGAVIEGPAFIGANSVIGPNCLITGGCYIGPNSSVGQGSEVKSSILLSGVRMFHFSYIGHSILGHDTNIAAGCIASVRRLDNQPVYFRFQSGDVTVGPKGGVLIGDRTQLGIATLLCPGRQVGPDIAIPPGRLLLKNVLDSADLRDVVPTSFLQPQPDNLELWKAVANLKESESDRFWSRNNVLLVVNGGLILLLARAEPSEVLGILTALVGFALAIIWRRVNRIGKYYVDRWTPTLKKLEETWSVKPISHCSDDAEINATAARYQASTTYMIWLINMLGGFWLAMLLINFAKLMPTLPSQLAQVIIRALV